MSEFAEALEDKIIHLLVQEAFACYLAYARHCTSYLLCAKYRTSYLLCARYSASYLHGGSMITNLQEAKSPTGKSASNIT